MTSYESVLSTVVSLTPSLSSDARTVEWLTGQSVVGVSRTVAGQIEIFLAGPKILANSREVSRALEHQTWHRAAPHQSIDANRLLLPAVGHFDQVAAFLCAELLRSGSDSDLAASFAQTEPIIELAIAKLRVTDEALLGLTGEMLLLDSILRNSKEHHFGEIMESWHGWRESVRDFTLRTIGVEVKTTTRSNSSHLVEGIHQVELQDVSGSGYPELALKLVSIGLQLAPPNADHAYSLPALVDSIVGQVQGGSKLVHADIIVEQFLDHIREYGEGKGAGYDHRTMSTNAGYSRRFVSRFVRGFDMTDPLIEVIRTDDMVAHRHVDADSLKFRIELPATVRGDINPIVGLNGVAASVVTAGAIQ